jgi:hypothetical protein
VNQIKNQVPLKNGGVKIKEIKTISIQGDAYTQLLFKKKSILTKPLPEK